ncbi:MAG: RIP metalloprotease RseP [Chloroflexi bacterium]|nr:RIP metalloprotease RseP [Chloroflexota bacterium]
MFEALVGNSFFMTVIAFAIVLIPAVIIHELGHLLAAKAVGITILEFGIGFPPRATKLFRWGETEFTLNWLPLGGFVIPLGEDFIKPVGEAQVQRDKEMLEARLEEKPKRMSVEEEERERIKSIANPKSVNDAKPAGRILFMAGGALANFVSAVVLFIIIALIGLPQSAGARVVVAYVTPDSPAAAAGLQSTDVIERLNGQTFESPEAFFVQLDRLQGQEARLTVRRGTEGAFVDVVMTPEAVENTLQGGYVRVMVVVDDAPAGRAGLQPGDFIVAFNGEPITTNEQLIALTDANLGQEVVLDVLRPDGTLDTLMLTPRAQPPAGQGPMGIAINSAATDTASGIIYQRGQDQQILVSQSLPDAIRFGFERTGEAMLLVARMPIDLISGALSAEEARPVSIVGISSIGGQFLQESIQENQPTLILNYIALISIALGVTNLLPLPALDGGRIVFVLLEIVRGRPIKPEFEGVVHLVGLVLLLSVAVIFVVNDIVNPIVLP